MALRELLTIAQDRSLDAGLRIQACAAIVRKAVPTLTDTYAGILPGLDFGTAPRLAEVLDALENSDENSDG